MTTEFFASLEECSPAFLDSWQSLASAEPRDGFFRGPHWYRAWLQHVNPRVKPLLAAIHDERQKIVGVAPLCRLEKSFGGFNTSVVEFGGGEVVAGDYLGLLAANRHEYAIYETFLRALSEREWDVFSANEVVAGGPFHAAVTRFARENEFPLGETEFRICPYLTLTGSFDEYLTRVSKTVRYNFRRGGRELQSLGARIERLSDGTEISERIAELVALSAQRWTRKGRTSSLQHSAVTPFLRELAGAGDDSAVMYRIADKSNRTSALLLQFQAGENILYYQAGFDPASELARYSPGVALIGTAIRDALESGFRYFDFLRGHETYKTDWTYEARVTTTVHVGRGTRGRLFLARLHAKKGIKILAGRGAI